MTKARAQFLLSLQDQFNRLKFAYEGHEFVQYEIRLKGRSDRLHPEGITPEEDAYIKQFIPLISGHQSYYHALAALAGVKVAWSE